MLLLVEIVDLNYVTNISVCILVPLAENPKVYFCASSSNWLAVMIFVRALVRGVSYSRPLLCSSVSCFSHALCEVILRRTFMAFCENLVEIFEHISPGT